MGVPAGPSPHCSALQYSLQLNIYARLLTQITPLPPPLAFLTVDWFAGWPLNSPDLTGNGVVQNYGLPVGSMWLGILHPEQTLLKCVVFTARKCVHFCAFLCILCVCMYCIVLLCAFMFRGLCGDFCDARTHKGDTQLQRHHHTPMRMIHLHRCLT